MEIIYFLKQNLKSKFLVLHIIELSKNGYFFKYFRDQGLIKFINFDIIAGMICSFFNKKIGKNIIYHWRREITDFLFCSQSLGGIAEYLKKTDDYEFWNKIIENSDFSVEFWLSIGNLSALDKYLIDEYFDEECPRCYNECCDDKKKIINNIKYNIYPAETVFYLIDRGFISYDKVFIIAVEYKREDLVDYNRVNDYFNFLDNYVKKRK